MNRFLCFCVLLVVSSTSFAEGPLSESGIRTSIFALQFPPGWKLQEEKAPVPLRGPHGELMLISPILPAPNSKGPSGIETSREMQEFWRGKIKQALSSSVSRDNMTVTQPFEETKVSGLPFFMAASRDAKQGAFLGAYGLIGKNGVVFIVTVEGWLQDETTARAATEQMIKTIKWHAK